MHIKTLSFSVLSILFYISTYAQNEFITTWQVSGSDLSIQIPVNQSDFTYNYTIDFGDGTVLNNQDDDLNHTYSSAGTYTVKISGQFPSFAGGDLFNNDELMSVEQWGNIQWQSMREAFDDCYNLTINATDTPDLNNVTDMSYMFASADLVNSTTISNWDVSKVTNMEGLFANADSFNQPLNNWDVSSVENMNNMFSGNNIFNQPLNNWVVSNVTSMSRMFYNATSFNQALDNWNVSNVTNMQEMFKQSVFNQPLGSWNTSSVTNMREMFNDCPYNHPLNSWNVSNVTNMVGMFEFSPYNHPLDNWDTGNVTNMDWMFYFSPFNHDISSWDVSAVEQMQSMFQDSDFNQPIDNWDVSNVEFMANMFESAAYNQPLNSWDVSNTSSMFDMFKFSSFNQPLDNWDVSSVGSFQGMFTNSDFNQDLSSWYFNESDLDDFIRASEMSSENYDLLLGRFVQLGLENGYLDADFLSYCDIFTREKLIDDFGWTIEDDELGDACNVNYISGNVKFDENGDGCDFNDIALNDFVITANNGQDDISTLTDDQGDYLFTVNQGNFSVEMLNLPSFLSATPTAHSVSLTNINELQNQQDFCITSNQSVEDISIELFPLNDARPGFGASYEINIENNGTVTASNVQITINFDGTKQSFDSASQTPSNSTSNSLTFTISSLPILSSETINFTLSNEQPPVLNGGDILTLTGGATPDANDENPDDNNIEFDQIVVNSFDPNDKIVIQGDQIADENIDEYLDYKIRFQNKGTANAINVVITDTISDKLDWTTFQPINSSHDYRLEFVEQTELNFIFENINLPYESIDEPGSNGFVSFKIKPKSDVQIGDIIENEAYIFFDFNAPILTNTVATEIVDNLGNQDFETSQIKIYPNPVEDHLHFDIPSQMDVQNIRLFSREGKLLKTIENTKALNLQNINAGLYLLQITADDRQFVTKVIKQ